MRVAIVIGLVAVLGLSSCRCSSDGPAAPDAAPTATQGVVTGSASAGPGEAGAGWENVLELGEVAGDWGKQTEDDSMVDITSREVAKAAGKPWPYPYPWHVLVFDPSKGEDGLYDCGLHEKVQPEGWRVAYCQNGAWETERRNATTMHLQHKELPNSRMIRVRIGSLADVSAIRK